MIVAVQGTRYGNNEAAKVLASLAVTGVHNNQKTSLILQFTNRTRKSVENYLIGKKIANESLVQDASVSDPTVGMDALCANSATAEYKAALFSEISRPLTVSNIPNAFDIAFASQKESFEREILNKNKINGEEEQSFLESMLRAADKIYDIVYMLVPSKNEALAKQLVDLAEVNVICIYQGKTENVVHGGQREYYVVTDYCNGSAYSGKVLAQAYGQKTVFGLMHNVLFNDACTNGVALEFLDKQLNAKQGDANYNFIHNIVLLYNAIVRNKERKANDVDLGILKSYQGPKLLQFDWEPINASVVTTITKTGTFKQVNVRTTKLQSDNTGLLEEAPVFTDTNMFDGDDFDPEADFATLENTLVTEEIEMPSDQQVESQEEISVQDEPEKEVAEPKEKHGFFKKKDKKAKKHKKDKSASIDVEISSTSESVQSDISDETIDPVSETKDKQDDFNSIPADVTAEQSVDNNIIDELPNIFNETETEEAVTSTEDNDTAILDEAWSSDTDDTPVSDESENADFVVDIAADNQENTFKITVPQETDEPEPVNSSDPVQITDDAYDDNDGWSFD